MKTYARTVVQVLIAAAFLSPAVLAAEESGRYDRSLDDFPALAGETDDTARFQRAIDASAGRVLYVPKGDYGIASTLTISNGCSLSMHRNARLSALAPMSYVLCVRNDVWATLDFKDGIEGGIIDGKGVASCLSLDRFWAYRLENVTLLDPKGCGLHVAGGSAELVVRGLLVRTDLPNLSGNVGMLLDGGDNHFNDLFILNCTTGIVVKGASNRFTSVRVREPADEGVGCFVEGGHSSLFRECSVEGGTTGFALDNVWEVRLLNCSYGSGQTRDARPRTAIRQTGNGGALLVKRFTFVRSDEQEDIRAYEGNDSVRWVDLIYRGPWGGIPRPGIAVRTGNDEEGLVAHFTFDDATKFGYDAVSEAEIGAVSASNPLSPADVGDPVSCVAPRVRGMQFASGSGRNNWLTVAGASFGSAHGIPCGNQAVTYSLWIRPAVGWQGDTTDGLGTVCMLLRHGPDGHEWWKAYDHHYLYLVKDQQSGLPQLVFAVGEWLYSDHCAAYALPQAFDGGWHFVAVTYDNRVITLYYDGEKVAEKELASGVGLPDNSPLMVGAACPDAESYRKYRYAGSVDDLKVYNRALDAMELQTAYRAGATAVESDVMAWRGAAYGGAAEVCDNWEVRSNRRTQAEVVAAGSVWDLTTIENGGVVTQGVDERVRVKGVICTNGQDEVKVRLRRGILSIEGPPRPVAHFAFEKSGRMFLDYGPAGLTATTGVWAYNGTESTAVPIRSVDGVVGKAMEIPASGSWSYWPSTYVTTSPEKTVRARGIPSGNAPVTYSLWIRPYAAGRWDNGMLGLANSIVWVFRRGDFGQGRSTYLWLTKGSKDGRLVWSIANWMDEADTCTYEPDDLFDGNWHHVVCVYANRTLTLYYDGAKVGTKATSRELAMADGRPIVLGNPETSDNRDYNYRRYLGGIDEFKLYDVALTDEEVREEYERR